MKNSGWELTVGFTPIRTKDFTWNVSMNTSNNSNTVTETGVENVSWSDAASGTLYKKGYSSNSFWAFRFKGIDPKTGYPIIDLSTAEGADKSDPTSYMEYAGKLDPDFTGGISMSFRYKQLALTTSLNLRLGCKTFLRKAYQSIYLPSEFENLSNELVERWTPTNTNADFPGLPDKNVVAIKLPDGSTYLNPYEMYNYSTARVVNASSLSCNSVDLSYTFDTTKFMKALHIKGLSLSTSLSNLFIIHSGDFKGRDPEVAMGMQPRTKSLTFNANVTF